MDQALPRLAPPGDAAEQLWQLWRRGQRPDVEAFLAGAGPLSPAELAGVLRVDQRERWQAGERVHAETYLAQFPALGSDPEAAVDLVYNEFRLREQQGERPTADEYRRRFPAYAEVLAAQLDLHHTLAGEGPGETLPPELDGAEPSAGAEAAWELPGYEVLGEVGRGGMGVVYRARVA